MRGLLNGEPSVVVGDVRVELEVVEELSLEQSRLCLRWGTDESREIRFDGPGPDPTVSASSSERSFCVEFWETAGLVMVAGYQSLVVASMRSGEVLSETRLLFSGVADVLSCSRFDE